jgi:hypothetical protein
MGFHALENSQRGPLRFLTNNNGRPDRSQAEASGFAWRTRPGSNGRLA